jgi:hypothetical protein
MLIEVGFHSRHPGIAFFTRQQRRKNFITSGSASSWQRVEIGRQPRRNSSRSVISFPDTRYSQRPFEIYGLRFGVTCRPRAIPRESGRTVDCG